MLMFFIIEQYRINEVRSLQKPVALFISMYFPPEPGGGATAAWNRATILDKIGYKVLVLTGFPSYPNGKVDESKYRGKYFYMEKVGPFFVYRLRLFPLKHEGFLRRLLLFLNFLVVGELYIFKLLSGKVKLDLVYSLAPIMFSCFMGKFISSIFQSFFIYEAADLWPEELVVTKSKIVPFITPIGKLLARITYSLPDMIITVSWSAAEYIKKYYRPRVPVYGIPIGVDPAMFAPVAKHFARDYLISRGIFPGRVSGKFIVLYSGLLSSAQCVKSLAIAALQLTRDRDIEIIIVGDGEEKEDIEQFKVKHNLPNLHLLPYQPRSLIPMIVSAADVCTVLLSPDAILNIALPTKFYEYLCCKKAIIGVCDGELANVINEYHIGLTSRPDNIENLVSNILKLKDSPNLLKEFETNCDRVLQLYSLPSIAKDFSVKLMASRPPH